ncbi:MAG: metallophosphoesterase family protein [Dehalococcoidia bacterium]
MTEQESPQLDELDAALDQLVRSGHRSGVDDTELEGLLEIAARLRGLPDPEFRARLLDQLLPPRAGSRSRDGIASNSEQRGENVTASQIPTDVVSARRIGLIADNHSRRDDGSDLPQVAVDALQGVDLILHCGDPGNVGTLDRLEMLAPVLAVPGGHVEGGRGREDGRLAPITRVVEAGGVRIGVIHEIDKYGIEVHGAAEGHLDFPDTPMTEILSSKFGRSVDVVAFGGTHRDMVVHYQGVLLVNPGSPNLPAQRGSPDELGTVAILDVGDGVVSVEVVRLKADEPPATSVL